MKVRLGCVVVGFLSLVLSLAAQTSGSSPASAQVPPLIQFSSVATDEGGNTLSGVVSITFSLYNNQQGGEPLWMETQNNVQLDPTGHYSVQLGITKRNGVPTTLFTTGEARWLGVRIGEQAEQPRVLLLSVPYAMKAGDAATIGGLPPSAFVLAAPPNGTAAAYVAESVTGQSVQPAVGTAVTGTGKVNYLPLWDTTSDIISSVLFQSGTGSTAKIGVNTITPASTLDVKGGGTIRGTLSLPATGAATTTAGKNSQPLNLAASAFSSTTSTAVSQTFQWQTEPAANDTSSPSGTLNLLFGTGATKPSETGLHVASNGQITFATGQTFPGTGDGTVTSVGSGLGLTGGPITTSGTLTIDTTVVPQLNVANTFTANQTVNGSVAATSFSGNGSSVTNVNASQLGGLASSAFAQLAANNTFTGNQTVNGNLSATGVVTGSGFQIGSNLFAFGSYTSGNVFLGFAGNTTMTGGNNTASGLSTLYYNTTGFGNTASGLQALYYNNTGIYNTASGYAALGNNTTGIYNTAIGSFAGDTIDSSYVTGSYNTAVGGGAYFSTGTLTNATVIGSLAEVTESNAMVLGSINGVLGATASTNVGIGTTAPTHALEVSSAGATSAQMAMVSSGSDAAFSLKNTGSGGREYWIDSGSNGAGVGAGNFAVYDSTAGATRLVVNKAGNVGIGTISPDDLLTVNSSADKPGGGSWGTFSDGRLKNLNGSFNAGLSQVLKIRPVRYRYKPDNAMGIRDTDEHIGVVAQDVQRVIPEAVTENNKGYLLVNNDPIIWTMLNAIKEQQREFQQQQAVLRTQAAAIRNLKSELRATRQTLEKVKAQVATAQPTLVATK